MACACARDPRGECPEVSPGDLVISELSRAADHAWIELYNAGGADISLGGVAVSQTQLDGTDEKQFLVHERTPVAPAAYAVIGAPDGLFESGFLRVRACDVVLDELVYRTAPATGTLALDGVSPPDAQQNDLPGAFCIDPTGSPGQGNLACP